MFGYGVVFDPLVQKDGFTLGDQEKAVPGTGACVALFTIGGDRAMVGSVQRNGGC